MRVQPSFFDTSSLARDRRLCLVLMPFTKKFSNDLARRIKEICKTSHDIRAVRADDIFSVETVMQSVWDLVVSARFIVADLTGGNPNVLYELGLAHALGKYVILISQDKKPLFDVAAIRYLHYTWDPDGMPKLEADLRKYIDEAYRATSNGDVYYPQSDAEADASWEQRLQRLESTHRRELDRLRDQQRDLERKNAALEAEKMRKELEAARLDRTAPPREIMDAMHVLDHVRDPDDKLKAIAAIRARKNSFPITHLFHLLERERNERVRLAAIECIGELGDPHNFGELQSVLERGVGPKQREACLLALFKLDEQRALRSVADELRGTPQLAELLLRPMYLSENSWEHERVLLESLLDSEQIAVRWMALKVLTKHTDGPWSSLSLNLADVQMSQADESAATLVGQCIEQYRSLPQETLSR